MHFFGLGMFLDVIWKYVDQVFLAEFKICRIQTDNNQMSM